MPLLGFRVRLVFQCETEAAGLGGELQRPAAALDFHGDGFAFRFADELDELLHLGDGFASVF